MAESGGIIRAFSYLDNGNLDDGPGHGKQQGDVHPSPSLATKYPCPVCARNVTSRGVSYFCHRCSGWVHSKCSGLQNAAEYRRIIGLCIMQFPTHSHVGLGVGSWPSNRATEGSTPKGT